LRRHYNGRTNTAEEFGRLKLHPVEPPPPGAAFKPTCHRWTVILPPEAPDELADPQRLLASFDAAALPWKNGLLTYATIRYPSATRLNVAYEDARQAARKFALARLTPIVLVFHTPHVVGSSNPPHCHFLILPRILRAWWGPYDDALIEDAGQKLLFEELEWAGG
jgi:hypothetical protein